MKPILVVHGYADHHNMPWWSNIVKAVKKKNPKSEVRRVKMGKIPGATTASPKKYARSVRKAAKQLYQSQGEQVSIISHSMGGISARYAVEFLSCNKIVDNVVTLGTPHRGTLVAYLAYLTKGGRSLTPKSDLLEKLNNKGLSNVIYTSIWGSNDFLVRPPENAMLPENIMKEEDRNIHVDDIGHTGMILSPEIVENNLNYANRCKL